MKSIKIIFLFAMLLGASVTSSAQGKTPVTTSFWVAGVCEMCKERIERALDVPGVRSVSYELDAHQVTVVYQPKKITEDKLHNLLNAAGHDTSRSMASEEAYQTVHDCCKYREHEHNH